ncbi:hypothetical protein D7D52_06990 [Nocardia yunnanensis]|uniref:Uncharacterized protein n=1 Tax=Nocardia yunnanensis TaxID=2382165 RepID=A0A386Z908_9NOCA|nr:hypothetical protein [Nocardia yunnanensis]AYF73643.1 hypothetical protein D7D52_06990 [Nocardia yunnanensis]
MTTEEERIHQESARQDDRPLTDEPEVTDEHRDQAHDMAETYKDDRPLTVLPGSDGMVTGTAVTDWIDEDGNPTHESPDTP